MLACGWTAAALLALFAIQVETGVLGPGVTAALEDYLYNALLLAGAGFCLWRAAAVNEERLAWTVMGAAIAVWTAGNILWTALWASDPNAPYPSVSDALWLAWYPASLVVLYLLVRSRIASFRASLWLDGAIGALSTVALAFAFAYGPIADSATGSTAAVLTNLAYPLGDTVILGVVVAIFGLTGWRPGRAWLLIGRASLSTRSQPWCTWCRSGVAPRRGLARLRLAGRSGRVAAPQARRGAGRRGPEGGCRAVHVRAGGSRVTRL